MASELGNVLGALYDLFKEYGVKCLVQVGAEDGYEAAEIHRVTGCRAIAIEGDERCKPYSPDIKFCHAVIGATDCQTTFYRHDTSGLSTTMKRDAYTEIPNQKQYRLDTFCREMDITPDALIIDTEGTTLDVLEGCRDLLDGVRVIYAECQTKRLVPDIRLLEEVDSFLTRRGFKMRGGMPSYDCGGQGNYTWVRDEKKPDPA